MIVTSDDWIYYLTPWATGSTHSVGDHQDCDDAVRALHAAVEEVTGKPVERERRRIGFY